MFGGGDAGTKLFILGTECDAEENRLFDWVETIGPCPLQRDGEWNKPKRLAETWQTMKVHVIPAKSSGDFYGFNTHPIVTFEHGT